MNKLKLIQVVKKSKLIKTKTQMDSNRFFRHLNQIKFNKKIILN